MRVLARYPPGERRLPREEPPMLQVICHARSTDGTLATVAPATLASAPHETVHKFVVVEDDAGLRVVIGPRFNDTDQYLHKVIVEATSADRDAVRGGGFLAVVRDAATAPPSARLFGASQAYGPFDRRIAEPEARVVLAAALGMSVIFGAA